MLHTVLNEDRSGYQAITLRHFLGHIAAWVQSALIAGGNVWMVRRDARMLIEMPDHLLKDLGIERADIARVVRHGRTPVASRRQQCDWLASKGSP